MSVSAGTPVRDALEGAITAFAAAGCDTPRLDAEVLLAHVLRVSRERLLIDDLQVSGPSVPAYRDVVRRRAIEREPVAYITGRKGFRMIELRVDSRALIPRPETELLVEVALSLQDGSSVLDLCTGSGAVALALASERPDLEVSGSDISEQALSLASENAERLKLPVQWLHADLLQGVPDEHDALLCNPPYVAEPERRTLAPEIVRHEPQCSLFAGEDGLSIIRPLIEQAGERERLRTVAIEIGDRQADAVAPLLEGAGFKNVQRASDLAGVVRVLVGKR